MRIIELTQRSPQWLHWRNTGIGSSDIAAIVGLNPYKKSVDVFNEKMGRHISQDNKNMKRGRELENEALSWAINNLGVDMLPLCIEDEENPWMKASLDGYNELHHFLIEIKIPLEKNFISQIMKLPEMYEAQVQWQMLVSGCHQCKIIIYSPESPEDSFIYSISEQKTYQNELFEKAREFWFDFLLEGIPPDIEKIPEIFDLEALEKSKTFLEYNRSKKLYETMESALKQELLEYAIGDRFKIGNVIFKKNYGSTFLDKEKMQKDGIDISKYEKKGKEFWRSEIKK